MIARKQGLKVEKVGRQSRSLRQMATVTAALAALGILLR